MSELEYSDSPPNVLRETIISMAIESWRFSKMFERLLTKMDAGEKGRYINQFRWFLKKIGESLDQAGLRLVNVEGTLFEPGIAATPMNIEDFDTHDTLMVEQMLEPIIMGKEGLVKTGSVILRKVEQ
ncbi:MAG: hypothetical protein LBN28_05135 [Desulfovibrio sp.]|nr:hypothetical protein [Desulfovibrio sp.]